MNCIVSKSEMDRLLECTYAAAKDETRPVLMDIGIKNKTFAAISDYQVSLRSSEKLDNVPDIVLPMSVIKAYKTAKMPGNTDIEIITDIEGKVGLRVGEMTIIDKPVYGEFMDYKSLIPKDFSVQIKVEAQQLCKMLEIFKKELMVKLIVFDGSVQLSNTGTGEIIKKAVKNFETKGIGKEEFIIYFSPKLLLESLKAYKHFAYLQFTKAVSPVVILSDPEDRGNLDMVLPMRVTKVNKNG